MNVPGAVILGLAVVTTIVLLAVVPKHGPDGVAAIAVTNAPVTTTRGAVSTTTPGSAPATTTSTTTATTNAATSTTRKSTSTGNSVPTTTTFPVAKRAQLKFGSTGSDVVALQQRLTALGYYKGAASGNYDAVTKAAVIRFQLAKKLTADGLVGSMTWAALAKG